MGTRPCMGHDAKPRSCNRVVYKHHIVMLGILRFRALVPLKDCCISNTNTASRDRLQAIQQSNWIEANNSLETPLKHVRAVRCNSGSAVVFCSSCRLSGDEAARSHISLGCRHAAKAIPWS